MSVEHMRMSWNGDDGYVEEATAPFGYSLLLDLYHCRGAALEDIRQVYGFLEALIGRLGMTKQAPPFVFLSPPEFPDKAGISGWVPLIESGIQIHTLVPRHFVSIDVYCCRRFDPKVVLAIAGAFFQPQHFDMQEVVRGKEYSASSESNG